MRAERRVSYQVWFGPRSSTAIVFVAAVFLFPFIVVVGVPRLHRGVDDAQPAEDAFPTCLGSCWLPAGWSRHLREDPVRWGNLRTTGGGSMAFAMAGYAR
jgi:hypothetical protein